MLVNSVIIVLREVLEAALMISILLAISKRIRLGPKWLVVAIGLGFVGAAAYAQFLGPVSELFDGPGQELLNAAMQFGVFMSLVIAVFLVARSRGEPTPDGAVLLSALVAGVTLAIAQEGAEILVYVTGFMQMAEFVSGVSIGSLTGAGIGFVGASMCIQATSLLIQADWVQAGPPLWDTSELLREDSMGGQLLYALLGYEASPSRVEATMYAAGLVTMIVAALVGWRLLPGSGSRDDLL